jgi:hypothetical protein
MSDAEPIVNLARTIEALMAERDDLKAALEKALGALPGSADWQEARRALEGEK